MTFESMYALALIVSGQGTSEAVTVPKCSTNLRRCQTTPPKRRKQSPYGELGSAMGHSVRPHIGCRYFARICHVNSRFGSGERQVFHGASAPSHLTVRCFRTGLRLSAVRPERQMVPVVFIERPSGRAQISADGKGKAPTLTRMRCMPLPPHTSPILPTHAHARTHERTRTHVPVHEPHATPHPNSECLPTRNAPSAAKQLRIRSGGSCRCASCTTLQRWPAFRLRGRTSTRRRG
jgi:hypothetical protein